MNDVVIGINENELTNLTIEIMDYVDRISQIFDRIDQTMERLPAYYKGDSCDELMKKYRELKPCYKTIKENILTYSDDLSALIIKLRDNDKTLMSLFQDFTDETNKKIKSILN